MGLPDKKVKQLNRLPGAKARPDENQFLSARRIIKKQLEIDENAVKLEEKVDFVEDEKSQPSYPGIITVYRKRLIYAKVHLASASKKEEKEGGCTIARETTYGCEPFR